MKYLLECLPNNEYLNKIINTFQEKNEKLDQPITRMYKDKNNDFDFEYLEINESFFDV